MGTNESLKCSTDCLKAGPGFWSSFPTVHHEPRSGAAFGWLWVTSFLHACNDLLIGEASVGLLAEVEDLPQEDSKGPDVSAGGELAIEDGFWRHPSNRKHCTAVHPVS